MSHRKFDAAVGFKDVPTAGFSAFTEIGPPQGEKWMLRSINIQDDSSKFPLCQIAICTKNVWISIAGVGTPMRIEVATTDHSFYSELNQVVGPDDIIRLSVVTNVDAARIHFTLHYEVIY